MSEAVEKRYPAGEGVTVIWKPALCMHSRKCWKELPQVFDPEKRPWVNVQGANPQAIAEQVRRCPSGALSVETDEVSVSSGALEIVVSENGPLLINGPVRVRSADGSIQELGKTALCRCGASAKKPFCDGSHRKNGFRG